MPKYIELTEDLRTAAQQAAGIVGMYGLSQLQNGSRLEQLDFDTALFLENIDQLPAADVVPVKHGRWSINIGAVQCQRKVSCLLAVTCGTNAEPIIALGAARRWIWSRQLLPNRNLMGTF